MAEEIWIIESWEVWWSLNEWVTEEDIQRIQENTRQIKIISQQLKQNKKENNKIADFLTFLLKEINNENIIKNLYDSFFITIDPKTNIPYFRKSMNDIVIVWIFYPFYLEKAKNTWISKYFENLNWAWKKTIKEYMNYLQDLSNHYHDNIPINQNSFIQLLIEIFKEYLQNSPDNPSITNWWNIEDSYKEIIYNNLYT